MVVLVGCSAAVNTPRPSQVDSNVVNLVEGTSVLTPTQIRQDPKLASQLAIESYSDRDTEFTQRILHVLSELTDLPQEIQFDVEFLKAMLQLDQQENYPHTELPALYAQTLEQQIRSAIMWARIIQARGDLSQALGILLLAYQSSSQQESATNDLLSLYLWKNLISHAPPSLQELQEDDQFKAIEDWLELASLYGQSLSDAHWIIEKDAWVKNNFSTPPANWIRSRDIAKRQEQKHIAVLLPQSGSEAITTAAKAIRNGWMHAHLQNMNFVERSNYPDLRFYDTAEGGPTELINIALAQGADYVVGPLAKESVDQVMDGRSLNGRILLLNHPSATTTNQSAESLRHVAWSIEEEADLIASQIHQSDESKCVIFHGNQSWMVRATAQLYQRLPEDQEQILEVFKLADYATVTTTVGEGLGIESSNKRREHLQSVIRYNIEFEPRLNKDVNCVVAFTDPTQLESILAALRFHSDEDFLVFVSESNLREEIPDFSTGVLASVSPWLLYEYPSISLAIMEQPTNLRSFYALGFDAYLLANRWDSLSEFGKLSGIAGRYQLAADGMVRREPELAYVVDGKISRFSSSTLSQE